MGEESRGVYSRIVESALRLFSAKPYSKVSVESIAREAGVSKGAVFHYFKSKLDLAEKALSTFLERIVAKPLRSILASSTPFEEKVGRIVSLALAVSLRSNVKALLFLMSVYEELRSRGRGEFVRRLYEGFLAEIAEFLRESGVEKPEVRAMLLMAMLDGLSVQCMIAPEKFRDEKLVDELKAEIARMLRC